MPESLLRGLRKRDFKVPQSDHVSWQAFEPHKDAEANRAAARYEPAGSDLSVNWEDEPEAMAALRRDTTNAQFGVARVMTESLRMLRDGPNGYPQLRWERREIGHPRNPYHGNIIYPAGVPRHVHKAYANAVAVWARVVPEDET
ncbi:MAG: hypothetical protein AB7K71_11965 [Polyangiaceae bacterium]